MIDYRMSETRIIKKYSNRRLYDTERSVYVTLSDIKELVIEGVDLTVLEDPGGNDITRQILLQVITAQENGDHPMLTKDLLEQMIRFYGGAYQSMFTDYMNQTVVMFSEQQQAYQQQIRNMLEATGMSSAGEIAEKNMQLWKDMQTNMLKLYGFSSEKDK